MVDTLLSYTVLDADGDKGNVPVFIGGARTQAEIGAFNTFFAPLLDAVIDGQIVGGAYTIGVTLPGGLKVAPVANSERQLGALISFDNPSRFNWGLYVPTWHLAYFNKNAITADAAVASFLAAYVTGDGTVTPTNGESFDLSSVSKSRKAHRK